MLLPHCPGGFLPSSFWWGLIPYSFLSSSGLFSHHQGQPCWVVGSGLSGALSPPTLHLYLPAFISTPRTTQWRCTLHTGCEGGPGELTSRPGQGGGWQSRPLSLLPIPRDVHTCCALWLTSASHFPQQSTFPASLGRTSVGMVPVSLPFQSSWAWYDCFFGHSVKDASKERKPLMPQQFIKWRRLLNLEAVEPVIFISWSRRQPVHRYIIHPEVFSIHWDNLASN